MPMLPLFNQLVLPTLVSLYAVLTSFFPLASLHTKQKVTTVVENKIASPTPSVSPASIGKGKSKSFLSANQQTLSHDFIPGGEKEHKESSVPNTNSNASATLPPTSSPLAQAMTAAATISASGKTLHLTMKYPLLGGNITGTMSGDCTGNISGIYEGPNTNALSGKGSATCPIGFINIPVDITFSGKLLSSTDAQITYSVSAVGKTESGFTNLSLSQ